MNISITHKQLQKAQRYFSIDILKLLFCIFIIMYHSKGAFSHLLTNNKHLFALFFKNQTLLVDCFSIDFWNSYILLD